MQKISSETDSRKTLAAVLIVLGLLLVLKKSDLFFLPPFVVLKSVFAPLGAVTHVLFSWPAVLILVGLVLMAGKRPVGLGLLVLGGVFLIPKLFFFSGAMVLLFFPLLLIGLGITLLARFL